MDVPTIAIPKTKWGKQPTQMGSSAHSNIILCGKTQGLDGKSNMSCVGKHKCHVVRRTSMA